jgi:hypothetical protein
LHENKLGDRYDEKKLNPFVTLLLGLSFFVASAAAQTVSWKQVVGMIPANYAVGSGTGAVSGGFAGFTIDTHEARGV